MCPWDEEKKWFNCSLDIPMGISLFRVVKTIFYLNYHHALYRQQIYCNDLKKV